MIYTTVKNLSWCNAEHTMFNCIVYFTQFGEEMSFACDQAEVNKYPHVASIWNRAMAGEFGSISEYVAPVQQEPVVPESL